jgi:hypothetical protein
MGQQRFDLYIVAAIVLFSTGHWIGACVALFLAGLFIMAS